MITYGAFEPDLILNQVHDNKIITLSLNEIEFNVKACSLRLMCFKNNKKCVCCGIEGSVILLQKATEKDKRAHFNFYALSNYCKPVLMTKDHILPSSKGGKTIISNLQTMCEDCNNTKSNCANVSFEEILQLRKQRRRKGDGDKNRKEKLLKNMRNISRQYLENSIKLSYNKTDNLSEHVINFIEKIDYDKKLQPDELLFWSKLIEANIIKV